jgi:hypothetical protein
MFYESASFFDWACASHKYLYTQYYAVVGLLLTVASSSHPIRFLICTTCCAQRINPRKAGSLPWFSSTNTRSWHGILSPTVQPITSAALQKTICGIIFAPEFLPSRHCSSTELCLSPRNSFSQAPGGIIPSSARCKATVCTNPQSSRPRSYPETELQPPTIYPSGKYPGMDCLQ